MHKGKVYLLFRQTRPNINLSSRSPKYGYILVLKHASEINCLNSTRLCAYLNEYKHTYIYIC
jgi:hypothetical protein